MRFIVSIPVNITIKIPHIFKDTAAAWAWKFEGKEKKQEQI